MNFTTFTGHKNTTNMMPQQKHKKYKKHKTN